MLEAANGVRASFTFSADSADKISNLVFSILADGVEYQAYAQDLKFEIKGTTVFVVGHLSYLMDRNGHVFDENALSKAAFQLEFNATGGYSDGKLSIFSQR